MSPKTINMIKQNFMDQAETNNHTSLVLYPDQNIQNIQHGCRLLI